MAYKASLQHIRHDFMINRVERSAQIREYMLAFQQYNAK